MPGLDWSHLTVDDVLSLGVSVLMALITFSLAVWFACSIVENVAKMRRWVPRSNYGALLRENERLRDLLMDAREENTYLRKLYRNPPPRERDERQNAA